MRPLLALLLVVALAVFIAMLYIVFLPSPGAGPEVSSKKVDTEDATRVLVYKPKYVDDTMVLEASSVSVPAGRTRLFAAISELLKDRRVFPEGVRLLSAGVKGRTAVLDFSKELLAGYSTDEEEAVLKSLAATVGQFPEVNDFQILVEGSSVDTLGSVDLTSPLPVTRSR